jgi:proline iminopeptidase
MKRFLLITGVIVLVLIGIGAVVGYRVMNTPIYTPGSVVSMKSIDAPLTIPAQGGKSDFWDMEKGVQIKHFSQGNGRNILVIHGGPGMPGNDPWPGLNPLCDRFIFHHYHQRGSGDSSRPDDLEESVSFQEMQQLAKGFGMGAQIADIERIRQILGEDKLVLVGHSFGGFMATLYALEFPENVKAMVLIAPANMLVLPQESDGLFEIVENSLAVEKKEEFQDFMEDYLDFGSLSDKSDKDLVEMNLTLGEFMSATYGFEIQEVPLPGGWMTHAIYMSLGRRYDYRDELTGIQAPVLIVHGAKDLIPEEISLDYQSLIPGVEYHRFEKSTHFPFIEEPQEFGEVVQDFLERVSD